MRKPLKPIPEEIIVVSKGYRNMAENEVAPTCMNEDRTVSKSDPRLTQRCSGTVLWDVVDKDGTTRAIFSNKEHAFKWARLNMPGQQDSSDDDEKPNGWDIQSYQR